MRWARHGLVAVAAALALLLLLPAMGSARASAEESPTPRRVVILSVPGLTWADVNDHDVPNLKKLLDESAVANLSTRVRSLATKPGDGYATLGAGTRSLASEAQAPLFYDVTEPYGVGTAAEEYERQHGEPVGKVHIASLAWPSIEARNNASEFDGTIGFVGDELALSDISRGVIANADTAPLDDDPTLGREAALGVVNSNGTVPCGRVDQGLLEKDRNSPFGLRLDRDQVLAAFDECSTEGSVVLVEASDLRRVAQYAKVVEPFRPGVLLSAALNSLDLLVGDLVDRLDLERDAIVVVGPSVASKPRLTVLGVHAKEYPPGLLASGVTRQEGYVTLVDVAPTILTLAGADFDEGEVEGRTVERVAEGGTAADRREFLEDAEAKARFRDRMLTPVAATYITAVVVLGLMSLVMLRGGRVPQRWLEYPALALLGVLPLTYVAALFPFHRWGADAYFAYLFLGGAALGAIYSIPRAHWLRPLVIAYSVIIAVATVSVVALRSKLQLSTVFGDSPIIAGRFSGINNITFSQMMVAAILLGAIAMRTRWNRALMIAILAGVLLVDVAPMWGADVGGILAGVPALAYTAALLGGWKIRWRTVVLWLVGTAVVIVLLGLFDLTRPAADRTHLGRLFERIGSEGWAGFSTVVGRKLSANLRSLTASVWRFVLIPVFVFAGALAWVAPGRLRTLAAAMPELRKALPGLFVVAVLGYALNDSGVAVPGMMLAALVPAIVYLLSRVDEPELAS